MVWSIRNELFYTVALVSLKIVDLLLLILSDNGCRKTSNLRRIPKFVILYGPIFKLSNLKESSASLKSQTIVKFQ